MRALPRRDEKTPARGRRLYGLEPLPRQSAAICPRIDLIALPSICRMRSADTPYSSARSCSVAGSFSASQRASMMRRDAVVEFRERAAQSFGAVRLGFLALENLHGLVLGVGQIGDRRHGVAVLFGLRIERDVAAGQPHLHLQHLVRLDAEVLAMARASLSDSAAERTFIRRRLKKSLRCALVVAIFTSRQLRSTYSWISARIQCSANETRRTPRSGIETAHGLHEADVAFLDQVGLRQPIAQVLAADGDDQPQMRQDEVLRGVEVVVAHQAAAELDLLLGGEQRKAIHRLDVLVQAPQRGGGGQSQRSTGHGLASPRGRLRRRSIRPPPRF